MFASGGISSIGDRYVGRGDIAGWDFEKEDFTTDYTWREFDLSGIVPVGAKYVVLYTYIVGSNPQWSVAFGENGNSNDVTVFKSVTQVDTAVVCDEGIVKLDADRKIQYKIWNAAWTTIGVAVKGWII